MKTIDFDYHLPDELIANYPLDNRSSSKLLVYGETISHKSFKDILNYFESGDLLVINNTSVIPARLHGTKESGGAVEVMLERIMENNQALVQIKSGRSPKEDSVLNIGNHQVTILGRKDNFFIIQFDGEPLKIFNDIGHVPLPPYIKRADEKLDHDRYATVYEDKQLQDSVAAPTAGLHFTKSLIRNLEKKGVLFAPITLHVGAGTFLPVKVNNILNHKMHEEWCSLNEKSSEIINKAIKNNKKIISVGTTSLRVLETIAKKNNGSLVPWSGLTDLFVTPGFKFNIVDLLITNFHLPKSTLLMLVSAFHGEEEILKSYKYAIKQKYRFFSYGDSCIFSRKEKQ